MNKVLYIIIKKKKIYIIIIIILLFTDLSCLHVLLNHIW